MDLFLLCCLFLLLSGWSWVGVRVVKQSLVSITPGERLYGGKSVRDEGVWDEDVRDEGVRDEGVRVGVRDEEVLLCEGYLVSDSQVRPWNV